MSNRSFKKQGCPKNKTFASAFDKLCKHIEDSEECRFALYDLKRIEEMMPESSSVTAKTLKLKLLNKYGDGVMFAQMKKTRTVACFRGSGLKLIIICYSQQKDDEKDERLQKVKTAATILCEDIRATAYNTTE